MSIFKETFRDFVFKQLKIREAIVKQGNNQGESRFGSPRTEIPVSPTSKEKISFPAGAFYTNTVEKQCTIRMSSGVDLREDNKILEEGKYEKERYKDLINEGLAIRYILEGGTPAKSWDFKSKRNLQEGGKYASVPRGDLRKGGADNPNFGNHYGASYGDPFIRSDAKDGFGIVPMPGIIDANIRTKTAYGSLREAKVNFVCHNRRQLEVLELLYMRPGYPVLLEWGWTPYISNEGKKEEYFPYIPEFFKQDSKISTIQEIILNRKKQSGGNYDGFIGYCKNFDIKSRPDGGYDCTTEIIAMGEVLEGLKGRREGVFLNKENELHEVDNLEFYLQALLLFLMDPDSLKHQEFTEFHYLFRKLVELAKFLSPNLDIREYTEDDVEIVEKYRVTKISSTGEEQRKLRKLKTEWLSDVKKITETLKNLVIFKGDEMGIDGYGYIKNSKSKHSYIRWDFLILILNNFIFPLTSSEGNPICSLTHIKDGLGQANPDPLEYIGNFLPEKYQKKAISFIKKSDEFFGKDIEIKGPLGGITDISIDPEICVLPHQITTLRNETNVNRQIGHIFIGVKFLNEKFKELRYKDEVLNDEFNLFNWLKSIWEGINSSCVNTHNFTLQTELERPNIVRVIDMNYESKLKPKDLFEINIQSNESIVRDFNINTTIPSSMGATIATVAQSTNSIDDLDKITFAHFNKNTKYRFNRDDDSHLDYNAIELLGKRYDNDQKSLNINLKRLLGYSRSMLGVKVGDDFKSSKGLASNFIKTVQDKILSLEGRYSHNGQDKENNKYYKGQQIPIKDPPPKSSIIPLKFTAQLDGIGGIVIGNVFKVKKDRLPKGYQGDEVAFVVMGENQKITPGQDWTTDITGQLILLDLIEPTTKINEQSDYEDEGVVYRDIENQGIDTEQSTLDKNLANIEPGDTLLLKINDSHTSVRDTPKVDNQGSLDYGDNTIGLIPPGNQSLVLGTMVDLIKLPREEIQILLTNNSPSPLQYWDQNGNIKTVQPGRRYFKTEFTEPIWYKIEFTPEAIDKINIGDVIDMATSTATFDYGIAEGGGSGEWINGNQGWLRMDVLKTENPNY